MILDKAYSIYDENESKIIKKFDSDFMKFSQGYKVNEWQIASLINNSVIKKCGYFESMPHNLSFVSEAGAQNVDKMITESDCILSPMPVSGYSLTPAACLHFYPVLEKKPKYNELITTMQKVYRYENCNYETDIRQWEFWVREVVAVGSTDYVKSFLSDYEKKALNYAKALFSEAQLRNATDYFYPTRENKIKKILQKKNTLKKELIVSINGKDVACASFNYHHTHFSKRFHFDRGGTIVTACVGFGLNRWYARMRTLE